MESYSIYEIKKMYNINARTLYNRYYRLVKRGLIEPIYEKGAIRISKDQVKLILEYQKRGRKTKEEDTSK